MQQQQPTSFSYLQAYSSPSPYSQASPPGSASVLKERKSNISLDEEVRLYTNMQSREKYENLADLYAIIVTMEHLEKAYIRDSITHDEYTPACTRLIAQFKTARNLVSDSVPDVEKFMRDYHLSCPAAVTRLLKIGVPATTEHAANASHDPSKSAKYIAETVQHFITLMDALKLSMRAVDELHPILADLIQSLSNSPLPPDFEGKAKVKKWLIELNQMKASDEITEEQARQMLFEMDQAHTEFHQSLSDRS